MLLESIEKAHSCNSAPDFSKKGNKLFFYQQAYLRLKFTVTVKTTPLGSPSIILGS